MKNLLQHHSLFQNFNHRIALWTHPRATSTAMERAFRERPDTFALHEPFFRAYYTGPNRLSQRFIPEQKLCPTTYESVIEKIFQPYPKPILFLKDMAYYLDKKMDNGFFDRITNTFLIRDPQDALISHYKISTDFYLYPEECGYFRLAEVFNLIIKNTSRIPIVIDAGDLCKDSPGILNAYCHALNIPFLPQMLEWRQSPPDEWAEWKKWHTKAAVTKSFEPLTQHNSAETPAAVRDLIRVCKQPYQELYQYRLKPLPYKIPQQENSCSFK